MSNGPNDPFDQPVKFSSEDLNHLVYGIKLLTYVHLAVRYPEPIIREATGETYLKLTRHDKPSLLYALVTVENAILGDLVVAFAIRTRRTINYGRLMGSYHDQPYPERQ